MKTEVEMNRITNWPDGCLNDDVDDSKRLLDIVYGPLEEGGDDA